MAACLTLHEGELFRYIAVLLAFGTPNKDSRHSWIRTIPTTTLEGTQAIPSSYLANLPSEQTSLPSSALPCEDSHISPSTLPDKPYLLELETLEVRHTAIQPDDVLNILFGKVLN